MKKRRKRTVYIVQAALIAAIYAAVTYFIAPLSFGAQQLRVSEALTVLPVLTPAAIPGLAIGCVIANLSSPFGLVDIICGSLATLIAAILSRMTAKIRFRNLPLPSLIFPVLLNGIIIGLEISFFLPEGLSLKGFLVSGGGVAIGEALSCYALGLPLFAALSKIKIFNEVNK
ncbi:MAG: QueT transporter family protein [Clostridia bacterium]|nr:QueT transporter family protein [Clostridia bacterium]